MQSNSLSNQVLDIMASIDGMASDVKKDAGDAVAESVLIMESNAKLGSPVATGRLRAGNKGLFDKSKLSGLLYNNVNYAAYHNFGTGKSVKITSGWESIAVMFKGAGEASVDIKGNSFFSNAYDKGVKELVSKLTKIVKDAKLAK